MRSTLRWVVCVVLGLAVGLGTVAIGGEESRDTSVSQGEGRIVSSLGRCLLKAGRTAAGQSVDGDRIRALTRSMERYPDSPYYCALRAREYTLQGKYDEALADCSEALRRDPDYMWALEYRLWIFRRLDRCDAIALADCNRLIDRFGYRDPAILGTLGHRAYIHLRNKRHAAARADLRRAIVLNPQDAGKHFVAWPEEKLSPEALKHGEEQVRRMLKDRPAMAEHVDESSVLWRWAARRFAGEGLPDTIDWDAGRPSEADAEHQSMTRRCRGRIRAGRIGREYRPGKPFTGDQLWAMVVFELLNMRQSTAGNRRTKFLAMRREITKEELVRSHFAQELRAMQELRVFFLDVYLPFAEREGFEVDAESWRVASYWGSLDEIFEAFRDKNAYPWIAYAPRFERYANSGNSSPRIWLTFASCAALLHQTERHLARDECAVGIRKCEAILKRRPQTVCGLYLRASLRFLRRDYESAAADCGTILAEHPELDYARELRALCLVETGRVDEGSAELEKVILGGSKWAESNACYGYALAHQDRLEEASRYCEKAVAADAKLGLVYYCRGFVRFKEEEFRKTVDDCTKAFKLDPRDDLALQLRAKAYEKLGQTNKAKADRAKARELLERRLDGE